MTTKNIYETLSVFVIDPMKGQARVFIFGDCLRNENTLAYFLVTEKKSFMALTPGANVIKLFTVSYKFS
jgi:hypothetical protein